MANGAAQQVLKAMQWKATFSQVLRKAWSQKPEMPMIPPKLCFRKGFPNPCKYQGEITHQSGPRHYTFQDSWGQPITPNNWRMSQIQKAPPFSLNVFPLFQGLLLRCFSPSSWAHLPPSGSLYLLLCRLWVGCSWDPLFFRFLHLVSGVSIVGMAW